MIELLLPSESSVDRLSPLQQQVLACLTAPKTYAELRRLIPDRSMAAIQSAVRQLKASQRLSVSAIA
jgi:hypothetical protein